MKSEAMKQGKRPMTKYVLAGLLAIAAGLAVMADFWLDAASEPVVLEHVTIANTAYAGTCPILVAQDQAYFEGEGLRVTIRPYTTGKAALDATLGGEADLGTSAELPIVFAVMRGEPVSVIATLLVAEKDYGIVGRRDRGIVTPADLKGSRIGVTLNTSGQFVLDAFLNRQRMSASDVELRHFKPEELAEAMARGDIDAASTWEPHLRTLREQLGNNAANFAVSDVYDSLYNLSARRDYIAKHPEIVKKVLRALIRGTQYCRESPDAASGIVARNISTDAAALKDLWSSYRFRIGLDQRLLLALEDQTRWAIRNRLVENVDVPNYLNHVYLDGLASVAPAAVTVIH